MIYVPTTLLSGHGGPKGQYALQEFLLVSRLGHRTDIVLHLMPHILNGFKSGLSGGVFSSVILLAVKNICVDFKLWQGVLSCWTVWQAIPKKG